MLHKSTNTYSTVKTYYIFMLIHNIHDFLLKFYSKRTVMQEEEEKMKENKIALISSE